MSVFSLLAIIWFIGGLSCPALAADPSRPEEQEGMKASGGPVTNASVEAGLRQTREALRRSPEFQHPDAGTHMRLATLLNQQGDPNGAIEEYQAAISLEPSLAEAYRGLGAVYIDKHEWQKAEQALQKSAELHYHDFQTFYWWGRALIAQEHFPQAQEALAAATQIDPKNPEAHSDLGLALMAQGQSKKAEKALENAIALQPDFAEAHYRLEQVQAAQNDPEKVIHSAHRILHTLFRRE